jgi:hypothetical protein
MFEHIDLIKASVLKHKNQVNSNTNIKLFKYSEIDYLLRKQLTFILIVRRNLIGPSQITLQELFQSQTKFRFEKCNSQRPARIYPF